MISTFYTVFYFASSPFYSFSTQSKAAYVSKLVEKIGLIGSQCTAALIIGSSAIFANRAYQIASKYEFEPRHDVQHHGNDNGDNYGNNQTSTTDSRRDKKHQVIDHRSDFGGDNKIQEKKRILKGSNENIIKTARKLFRRVPILGAMFCEVILAQCLSSLLNYQFVTEVKNTITDDEERAGFTGNVSMSN